MLDGVGICDFLSLRIVSAPAVVFPSGRSALHQLHFQRLKTNRS